MSKVVLDYATPGDLKTYFRWANDAEVRLNSYNPDPIQFNDHKNWFKKKLLSPDSIMYIFRMENENVGQVRFDINNNTALIDYSVDKDFRGKGLGSKILQTAIQTFKGNYSAAIVAHVKSDNKPSRKIFEKMKFRIVKEIKHNHNLFIVYEEAKNETYSY